MNEEISIEQAVPEDDPLMIAWKAYQASAGYANTRAWAKHDAHVDGSLWNAFMLGWNARGKAEAAEDKEEADDARIYNKRPRRKFPSIPDANS